MQRTSRDQLVAQGFVAVCPDLFGASSRASTSPDQSESEGRRPSSLQNAFDVDAGVSITPPPHRRRASNRQFGWCLKAASGLLLLKVRRWLS